MLLVVALPAVPCWAQTAAPSSLQSLVKPKQVVRVTDDQGKVTTGKVSAVTATMLDITSAGVPLRVPLDRIVLIRHPHDGLGNGALTGFVIGAGLGLAAATVGTECDEGAWLCPQGSGYVLTSTLLAGGAGAALGAAVDAIIRRDPVIFRGAPGSQIHILPTVGRRASGVAVMIRW